MKYRKNRKRGPVRSKKVVCDGITFASGLEKYMYKALKQANIKNEYEGQTYTLVEGFQFEPQATKGSLMAKDSLWTEEIKRYYQLNTLQILSEMAL